MFFLSGLRSRDYDSLEGELRRTDGCSHVMPGFTLVSISSKTEGGYEMGCLPALQGGTSPLWFWVLLCILGGLRYVDKSAVVFCFFLQAFQAKRIHFLLFIYSFVYFSN